MKNFGCCETWNFSGLKRCQLHTVTGSGAAWTFLRLEVKEPEPKEVEFDQGK